MPTSVQPEKHEVWIEQHDGTFVRRSLEIITQQATRWVENQYQKQFPKPDAPGTHEQSLAHPVTLQNQVRLIFRQGTYPVKFIGVSGRLAQSVIDGRENMRFLIRQDGPALVASCCVFEMRDGRLSVMAFDPVTRKLTPHALSVDERNRRKIIGIPLVRQTEMHRLTLIQRPTAPKTSPVPEAASGAG